MSSKCQIADIMSGNAEKLQFALFQSVNLKGVARFCASYTTILQRLKAATAAASWESTRMKFMLEVIDVDVAGGGREVGTQTVRQTSHLIRTRSLLLAALSVSMRR